MMKDETPAASQALVKAGTVITTSEEFATFLAAKRREGAHILSPITDIGSLPDGWKMVPSGILLSPNEADGDCYKDPLFCRGDEVSLTKTGLLKIAKLAGISIKVDPLHSGEVADFWAMKATATYRGHDGLNKELEASYSWDLREGSARLALGKDGLTGVALTRARVHGWRRCESGAINAVIRSFGLRQKYTKAELLRPFIVTNLVFSPTSEAERLMLAQAALGGTDLLYAPAAPLALTAPPVDGEIVNTTTGEILSDLPGTNTVPTQALPAVPTQALPVATKAEPSKERAFEDDPPAKGRFQPASGILVTSVGVNGSDYWITVEGGARLHTKDKSIASLCNTARKAKTPIQIVTEKKGDVLEILEVDDLKY
jgi:hypothetical protein